MISLIIPTFGGHPDNIARTIKSVEGVCDETVIISTAFFLDDQGYLAKLSPKVVQLDWNAVFLYGYGDMMNQGTAAAKNDWLMLLGVSETFTGKPIDRGGVIEQLKQAPVDSVFRCDHQNDPHTWGRVWNRKGGTKWSGLIHEEIVGGTRGGLLFRMQDTAKTEDDPSRQEAFRWIKTLTYNHLYRRLLHHPEELGGTNSGWLDFVRGAAESIEGFCNTNADLIEACVAGDLVRFLWLVENRMQQGKVASWVNFKPQGV